VLVGDVRERREIAESFRMLEKLFAVAIMVALVVGVFHLFGEGDSGPQAVVALSPAQADHRIGE
jgi:hypothetical protein